MFIAVDLPEPEGPMMATKEPRLDLQVDAGQCMHCGSAAAVDLVTARSSISGGWELMSCTALRPIKIWLPSGRRSPASPARKSPL